jgi:type III pantothenate kinase
MPALIMDAGNSRLKVARVAGRTDPAGAAGASGAASAVRAGGTAGAPPVRRIWEAPTPADQTERQRTAGLVAELARTEDCDTLVLCSVVPPLDQALRGTGLDVLVIDHTSPLPFDVGVKEPAAVGADRYCNLAAAAACGWSSAVIVDAGTATTIDLLLDGEFGGGLIAPGLAFGLHWLGRTAARLRPVPFVRRELTLGRDTDEALQVGSYQVAVAGVTATVGSLLERFGDCPVVVTGGLGEHVQEEGWRQEPDWTLRGAAVIARRAGRDL